MNVEQLGRLMDRHASALRLYARQWCDEAEDVVQDAFVKLASLRTPPASPDAWLFRAVRNASINAGIARRRRLKYEAEAASIAPDWFEPDRDATGLDAEIAQSSLAALPVTQREVIVAHLWGGLTFEQIGELAGTSSSSAHRLYHAGLLTLRERLGVACRPNTN